MTKVSMEMLQRHTHQVTSSKDVQYVKRLSDFVEYFISAKIDNDLLLIREEKGIILQGQFYLYLSEKLDLLQSSEKINSDDKIIYWILSYQCFMKLSIPKISFTSSHQAAYCFNLFLSDSDIPSVISVLVNLIDLKLNQLSPQDTSFVRRFQKLLESCDSKLQKFLLSIQQVLILVVPEKLFLSSKPLSLIKLLRFSLTTLQIFKPQLIEENFVIKDQLRQCMKKLLRVLASHNSVLTKQESFGAESKIIFELLMQFLIKLAPNQSKLSLLEDLMKFSNDFVESETRSEDYECFQQNLLAYLADYMKIHGLGKQRSCQIDSIKKIFKEEFLHFIYQQSSSLNSSSFTSLKSLTSSFKVSQTNSKFQDGVKGGGKFSMNEKQLSDVDQTSQEIRRSSRLSSRQLSKLDDTRHSSSSTRETTKKDKKTAMKNEAPINMRKIKQEFNTSSQANSNTESGLSFNRLQNISELERTIKKEEGHKNEKFSYSVFMNDPEFVRKIQDVLKIVRN